MFCEQAGKTDNHNGAIGSGKDYYREILTRAVAAIEIFGIGDDKGAAGR